MKIIDTSHTIYITYLNVMKNSHIIKNTVLTGPELQQKTLVPLELSRHMYHIYATVHLE